MEGTAEMSDQGSKKLFNWTYLLGWDMGEDLPSGYTASPLGLPTHLSSRKASGKTLKKAKHTVSDFFARAIYRTSHLQRGSCAAFL